MITLEQVDQMRKRTNCSYEEAKFFLEKHNGDVLEAIVDFEKSKRNTRNMNNDPKKNASDFWQSVSALIRKGFETRVVIEDSNYNVFINIPVNILLLFIIFAAYIVIPVLLIMMLLGYKLSIRKPRGEVVELSKIMHNVAGNGSNSNQNVQQQNQETAVKQEEQKDNYNEMIIE